MSLCLVCALAFQFDQSDWLKLIGIAGAMLVLYVLARKLSGGGEAMPPASENPVSIGTRPAQTVEPPAQEEADEDDSDEFDDEADEDPEAEASKLPFQISKWRFEHFDISTGPPDPDCFADQLWVDMFDPSTGKNFAQVLLVATPAGLEKMLLESKSGFVPLPQALLIRRYDEEKCREAVLEQTGAIDVSPEGMPPRAGETEDDES